MKSREATAVPGGEADKTVHGSAVALGQRGVLITGRAGSGKTTLALEMIALGAELIADDRVVAEPDESARVRLSAPAGIAGLVEVRGFGLIRLAARPWARLVLIADLDAGVAARLPDPLTRTVAGIACPVFLCKGKPGLAAALTCLLRAEDWPAPDRVVGLC